jgi:hypothetical protein
MSAELANLQRIGKLKAEPPSDRELAGLLASGERRLADASRVDLAFDSRFDLAYNAAHALALYALRRAGLPVGQPVSGFPGAAAHAGAARRRSGGYLARAHEQRNLAEYEGHLEHDDQLLVDLLAATGLLLAAIRQAAETRRRSMSTDISEKGLESLIVRHMTGTDGLAVTPGALTEPPAPYGGTGYFAGSPKDFDRAHALDVAQLFAFLRATQPEAFKKLAHGRCQ